LDVPPLPIVKAVAVKVASAPMKIMKSPLSKHHFSFKQNSQFTRQNAFFRRSSRIVNFNPQVEALLGEMHNRRAPVRIDYSPPLNVATRTLTRKHFVNH
jgi:hypothetical protein